MKPEDEMYGAILRGDSASVQEILVKEPSVLKFYAVKKTWLHWAAQKGHIDIMGILLNAGLPVDCLTSDGRSTPLNTAAGQGRDIACEWLLDHGADINRGLGKTATPIFSAIYGKNLKIVELFVERGANLDATFSEPKQDILGYAEAYGTPEIAAFLRTAKNQQS